MISPSFSMISSLLRYNNAIASRLVVQQTTRARRTDSILHSDFIVCSESSLYYMLMLIDMEKSKLILRRYVPGG